VSYFGKCVIICVVMYIRRANVGKMLERAGSAREYICYVRNELLSLYRLIATRKKFEEDLCSTGVKMCVDEFWRAEGQLEKMIGAFEPVLVKINLTEEEAVSLITGTVLDRLHTAKNDIERAGYKGTRVEKGLKDLIRYIKAGFEEPGGNGVGREIEEIVDPLEPEEQLAAMRKSMRELCGWVKNWSDACDEIKRAKELVPSEVEGFTPARKAELISCLMNAYGHLIAPGTGTLIRDKIDERMDLVEMSDAYVVEGSQVSGVQDAQAGAGVGGMGACMHALLRQLDALK
jgi:hypothetical protein